MAETKRERHQRRLEGLKMARNDYEDLWTDLAEYNAPSRLRLMDNTKRGQKLNSKIVDTTGKFALRTLKSGMHSGLTSPGRPWFRLTTYDEDLKEHAPVKQYLAEYVLRMRNVLAISNIYNGFHTGYGDEGLFGQSCGLVHEDLENYIGIQMMVHGRFWIASNPAGRVDTLYRAIEMTTDQVVREFADRSKRSISAQTQIPRHIRNQYDNGVYDELHLVYNAVEPRSEFRTGSYMAKDKRFCSNYWVDGHDHEHDLLRESGYDYNPIIAPRWETIGTDHYATESPGMDALPDVKMLQTQQTRKAEGIDKGVRPPMVGPPSLKNHKKSLIPGGFTYVDDPTGHQFRPAFQVQLQLAPLREDINDVQQRVREAYFADLFMLLERMEGVQPRNEMEIAERKEEKLLALGPVLEREYGEKLRPIINILAYIMEERGIAPEPPPDLQGQPLKIDFVSTLAQAQQAVATGAVERLWGFVGNIAAAKPDVLDKMDADQSVDEYAEMIGAPPAIVLADDKVVEIRAARQQQQQAMQAAEAAKSMAPAVTAGAQATKVLSEIDAPGTGGGADILRQIGLA